MAQTQGFNELLDALVLRVFCIIQSRVGLRIIKVYICDTFIVLHALWTVNAILFISNRELLELHDVLRQCARLVAENVANHTELFVQIRRLHLCW